MKTDGLIRLCKLLNREPPADYGKEVEDLLDAAADEIEKLRTWPYGDGGRRRL